jgi:hypothetical protein
MRSTYSTAIFLGAILMLSFAVQPILAQSGMRYIQSYISDVPNTTFMGNATQITSGTVSINFVGSGGNDTFNLYGGNASASFVVSGARNNTFHVLTGNPSTGTNSTTFSLTSGDNSTFNIVQNNFNGSVLISIIGGSNCVVNDTSVGPVNNTTFSINLGSNSTVILNSKFMGETVVNMVDPITHMAIGQTSARVSITAYVPIFVYPSRLHPVPL